MAVACGLSGCGSSPGNSGSGGQGQATYAPSITEQPSSITVPIGFEGIFNVGVSGDGTLTEQWYRDGVAISAADALSYTTPTVAAADTGSIFTFKVSNSLGSATSLPATLTAGARAPKAGDLRFQQVDSSATVNGYVEDISSDIPGRGGFITANGSGTPIWMESDDCLAVAVDPGIGCDWEFTVSYLPLGAPTLNYAYVGGFYSDFQTTLAAGEFPSTQAGGGTLLSPNVVINSLSINNPNNLFALSYAESPVTGFDLAQHTINPADIQAAATTEGLAGRVITAIGFDSGQLIYFSYGWTGDAGTVYDTITSTATFATAGDVATSMAEQGYIITALGGDDADGLVLVGYRVHGDTLARQILLATGTNRVQNQIAIPQLGYAIVGVVETQGGNILTVTWIGER